MAKQASRRYPYDYATVLDYTARAIPLAGSNYQVLSVDPQTGHINVSSQMNLMSWGNNMSIMVVSETPEWTRVDMVVSMKFGVVDWGQRSKDVAALFAAIDSVLPNGLDVEMPTQVAQPTPQPAPVYQAPPVVQQAPVATPAGWHPDPMARHELRYWDGAAWSEHVSDHGTPSVDPI
jgi:Protein of unknown function (DUF2510)